MGERKIAEALREWCIEAASADAEVKISDFTSSWRDGYALNLIIYSYE